MERKLDIVLFFCNCSRIALTANVAAEGTNVGATSEASETWSVTHDLAANTVWYSWTGTVDGKVFLTTNTSDYDSVIEVYTNPSYGNVVNALQVGVRPAPRT